MKMSIIIEIMIEKAVHIGIIIEDHLPHQEEEEEREAMTDTTTGIIGLEITTGRSIMKMTTAIVEEKKIQERVAIIIIVNILARFLLQDNTPGLKTLIKSRLLRNLSVIMIMEERRSNIIK